MVKKDLPLDNLVTQLMIDVERLEQNLEDLKVLLEHRAICLEKALEIQAIEYARRLEDSHEQLLDMQKTYLRNDSFERFESEYKRLHEAIYVDMASKQLQNEMRKRLENLEIWQAQQLSKENASDKATNIKIAIVSIVLVIVDQVLRFLKI